MGRSDTQPTARSDDLPPSEAPSCPAQQIQNTGRKMFTESKRAEQGNVFFILRAMYAVAYTHLKINLRFSCPFQMFMHKLSLKFT